MEKYIRGGDLFENYEEQPEELAQIVNFYMDKFNEGDYDYEDSRNFLNDVEAIGYTFDFGLDNEPYGLRPIGTELDEYAGGGGVGLKGNQSKIDMNGNGKLDSEDFKILRNSMNGAWRKEHKYVNSTSRKNGKVVDYEVRYARKNNPSRTGYKGKTNFEYGGSIKMIDGVLYEKVKFSNGIEDWFRSDLLHKVNFYCSEYGLNPSNQKDFEKALDNVSKDKFVGGGFVNWRANPTKKVLGTYQIKGKNIDEVAPIVFFEREDDENYSISPADEYKDIFRSIKVKSTALNSIDKGYSVKGELDNGTKVTIKRILSTFDGGGEMLNFKIGDEIKIVKPFPNGDMTGKKGKIIDMSKNNTGVIYILVDGQRIAVLSEYISKDKFYGGGKIEEVVLWATKIGEPNWEEKLITNNPSKIEEAKKWALANGFDRIRVAKINMSEKPDFTKTFDDGGNVTFKRKAKSIAKKFEGQKVEPKYQQEYGKRYDKAEAQEVGNKIAGKMKAMGMEKKAFGGFFGKSVMKTKPHLSLDEKQVMLKNGDFVQVLDHSGDTLLVMDLNKMGTGAQPKKVSITEVDESSYMGGGKVKPVAKKTTTSTKGSAMKLAKEIRKEGEKWTDAVKRANAQLKK
jgi:hypothetical protein